METFVGVILDSDRNHSGHNRKPPLSTSRVLPFSPGPCCWSAWDLWFGRCVPLHKYTSFPTLAGVRSVDGPSVVLHRSFFSNLSLFSTRACASRLFTLRLYLLLSLQIDISQSSPTKPLASCYQHFHYDSYLFPLSPPCFGPSHYLETIRQPTRINSSPK